MLLGGATVHWIERSRENQQCQQKVIATEQQLPKAIASVTSRRKRDLSGLASLGNAADTLGGVMGTTSGGSSSGSSSASAGSSLIFYLKIITSKYKNF